MKITNYKMLFIGILCQGIMIIPSVVNGQSGFFSSNIFGNRLSFNPSQAGIAGAWRADAVFKSPIDNSQPGLPKEFLVMSDGNVSESAGIGALLYTQNIGILKESLFNFNYAYGFKLNTKLNLRMGISAGFKSLRVNQNAFSEGSIIGDPGDPTLISFNSSAPSFYSAFGATVYSENLELQVVMPNLTAGMNSKSLQTIDYAMMQGAVTYKKDIGSKNGFVKLYAGGIQYKQTGTLFVGGLAYGPNDFLSINAMYNSSGAITGGAGVKIEKSINISFNYTVGGIYSQNIYGGSGVSEIQIGYLFNKKH